MKKGKGSKKSGRVRTAADVVENNDIPWPHYSVYKGEEYEAAVFDELTVAEFVYGYLDAMDDPDIDKATKALMAKHLRELMEDASTYPWVNVRNYHGVMLGEMERDRLTWTNMERIQRLRYRYAQKHSVPESSSNSIDDVKPCPAYQTGTCNEATDHDGLRHVCASCFKKKKLHQHGEHECFAVHGRPGRKPRKRPDSSKQA